eukprot:m.295039 g.295039  ORF g.295039 m.295039 type:complete len:350 (+) comp20036_c0_seq39:187-1236(+)
MASKLKSIYELNRVLGEGTFGKVYHGVDKSDQSEWAIKICKERYTKFEDCVLLPEVRSLIKLKKEATGKYGDSGFPHIILLRELIREKCGTLSLVFEFAHGQDLGWIVDNTSKPFTTNHVNFLAKQLFRGLAFMHRWYFHRDLKPENLMCSKDNCVLKIIDFGQARARRSKPPYTDYCGTRWYRAPELQLSGQVYGTPVDLWSAGCAFAELISWTPLFPATSEIDLIARISAAIGTPTHSSWPSGYATVGRLLPTNAKRAGNASDDGTPRLQELLRNASDTQLSVIQGLLQWESTHRSTAKQVCRFCGAIEAVMSKDLIEQVQRCTPGNGIFIVFVAPQCVWRRSRSQH